MEPSISSPTTPMQKTRSNSGSFDVGSTVFSDLEDESYNAGASYDVNGSYDPSGGGGGSGSGSGSGGGGRMVRGLVIKAACVIGGAFLLRKLTKSTTRWDHARTVAQSLSGEKFSTEQAVRDPMTYFNLRLLACPATVLADGGKVLYFEQAFWRTPERPYRQRFYGVKPCPKEMKCDVEVSSYAVRDIEEYRNFCDRPKDQRPQPDEVLKDMAEHLNTVYLSACERGRRCLYEGSTPPGGFPNSWIANLDLKIPMLEVNDKKPMLLFLPKYNPRFRNFRDVKRKYTAKRNGASRCTSELTIYKNGEVHCWDRAYDDDGNQVWGVRQGPYEFKPATSSSSNGSLMQSDFPTSFNSKQLEDTASATLPKS